MSDDLVTWQQVVANSELLEAAGGCASGDVSAVARLRKRYAADQTSVALQLVEARRKAGKKFGERAERIVADVAGVEQASSLDVTTYKASRFKAAGAQHVADVCCGIGGDAMGMADAGLTVVGVDLDPLRAWMTRQNAGCSAVVGDAADLAVECDALHLDPARRTGAGRVFRLADYQPGVDVIAKLVAEHKTAAVKLSPAVDLRELDEALPTATSEGQIEFISEAGRLVQAVLWNGVQQEASRAATRLENGQVHRLTGEPDDAYQLELSEARRYIFTADAAVERAGLLHRLGLPAIHPRLGLLTGDEAQAGPWLTGFELLAEMPYRPRKLKAWLHEHAGGLVEVKTRGGAVDTDRLQQELRGPGEVLHSVFVMRRDRQLYAWVTRRVG